MVESLEIEVPFVRTHENIADFFTKPMTKEANKFRMMRRIIMNEPPESEPDAASALGCSSVPELRAATSVRGGASECVPGCVSEAVTRPLLSACVSGIGRGVSPEQWLRECG